MLARGLSLVPPVSLAKGLLPALANLPFACVTRASGPLTANFVHGSAQVGMQSNGHFSFRMHVEEAGITGDDFLFVATLNGVKDNTGATLVLAHTGNVAGTFNIGGHSSADFRLDQNDQAIADNWDTVKQSTVTFSLHVSTNPFELTEGLLGGFVAVVLFKVVKEIIKSGVNCNWSSEDTDSGEMTQCTTDDQDPPPDDES